MGLAHLGRQAPSCVYRDVRIVPEHVHPELDRRVGHEASHLAQPDHTQRVARQLEAGELLLAVLDQLVQRLVVALQPRGKAQRRYQIPRREQHARDHQLLHRVGVGAGRVENGHAALAHLLHRDVVDPGARPAYRLDAGGYVHRVHVVGTHQDRVGVLHLCTVRVVPGGQALQSHARYRIERENLENVIIHLFFRSHA
jgi:hypothetical protein